MIYFLQALAIGPVKIGTTKVMSERAVQHATDVGRPVCVLGVMDGDRAEEQALHERFHHLRVGKRPYEWFVADAELTDYIAAETIAWDGTSDRPSDRKPMIVQVRGSEEYKTWVQEMAGAEHDTVAMLVVRAIREFAKARGYADPPRR